MRPTAGSYGSHHPLAGSACTPSIRAVGVSRRLGTGPAPRRKVGVVGAQEEQRAGEEPRDGDDRRTCHGRPGRRGLAHGACSGALPSMPAQSNNPEKAVAPEASNFWATILERGYSRTSFLVAQSALPVGIPISYALGNSYLDSAALASVCTTKQNFGSVGARRQARARPWSICTTSRGRRSTR